MPITVRISVFFRAFLIIATLLCITKLAFARTEQVDGSTNPALGNSESAIGGAPQTRKPSLQELYVMFFKYATHVEVRSNADERAGLVRNVYRHHLQHASGLTAEEYLHVLNIAQEFLVADADIEHRITDWNKTTLGDQGIAPAPSILNSSAYRSEIARLFAVKQSTLDSEIKTLRELIGTDRSEVLESYLKGAFSNPEIGAASNDDASTKGQETSTALQPGAERQSSVHDSSSVKAELTASPENVTLGYSPVCTDFRSGEGYLSSMCIQGTLAYLGPGNQVETWGQCTSYNVYGYASLGCPFIPMTENGKAMPLSAFYNCTGTGGTMPCDVDLSYGSNVQYNFQGEAIVYYWNGCSGPCSVTLGPTTLASVYIVYPSIASLSQTQFQAGQSGTLSITGSNLTSPFMNPPIIGDLWGCFSNLSVTRFNYPSQITANFSIPATLPSYLCEAGYGEYLYESNGFSGVIEPISITAAPPSITDSNGNPLNSSSSTPIQVWAGQPISLSVAAPSGQTIQSQSWSFSNSGDAIADFIATTNNGGPVPVTNTTSNNLNWFFIAPGATEKVTVNVIYTNLQRASTTEWYSVGGPTGDVLPTVTMLPSNQSVQVVGGGNGDAALQLTGTPVPGTTEDSGAVFQTAAVTPADNSGSFIWVQLITGNQDQRLNSTGPLLCPAQPRTGLDTIYPNDSEVSITEDRPSRILTPGDGERETTFNATMYLMWDPSIPPPGELTCQVATSNYGVSFASTCASKPVPLGSVSWHWSGCTINTLTQQANGTTWALDCGLTTSLSPQSPNYAQNYGYPTWTQVTTVQNVQCVPAN